MIQLTGKDKYIDLRKTQNGRRRILGLGIAALIAIIIMIWLIQNIAGILIVAISCSFLVYYIVKPPKEITLKITDEGVEYNRTKFSISELESWSVSDLFGITEIILRRVTNSNDYFFLYADSDAVKESNIIPTLTETVPFNQTLQSENRFHYYMRVGGFW